MTEILKAGDVGAYGGPATPDAWIETPVGHVFVAHEAFGWCSRERSLLEECDAWRLRAQRSAVQERTSDADERWHASHLCGVGEFQNCRSGRRTT
jgi:nicotinamide mononucleotide (NMN) deamidase PncC